MDTTKGNKNPKSSLYFLTRTAILTAVLCVLAPLAIPIGPVPVSLATLVIYFSLYLCGWKMGTVSVVVYLMIGMMGLPVFSAFSGGVGKLVGPTGGYIIGYIPMAVLSGLIISRYQNKPVQFLGLAAGTALCYAFGTAWFCYVTSTSLGAALAACVLPFIPGDLVKIVIAMCFGPMIRKKLVKAGLLQS